MYYVVYQQYYYYYGDIINFLAYYMQIFNLHGTVSFAVNKLAYFVS